jgi:hypothetical protein
MRVALSRQHAVDVFADRFNDGQIHYGLIFTLPKNADCSTAHKNSDLDTSSRHGQVDNWWLGKLGKMLPAGHAALLIPRTWLIRQGFLPWWVVFLPHRRFAVRNASALKEHIWLEWPARDAAEPDPLTAIAA